VRQSIRALMSALALALVVGALSPPAASGDGPPVKSIQVDEDGVYRPLFLIDDPVSGIFAFPPELLILGKVEELDEPRDLPQIKGSMIRGRIQVQEILRCPERLEKQARAIQAVVTDGMNGLALGDRVLVSMTPHGGAYAVRNHVGSNCNLGFRLPKARRRRALGSRDILRLLRSGHAWDPDALSDREWDLWKSVDGPGVTIVREERRHR
jgi:hypothetical protein